MGQGHEHGGGPANPQIFLSVLGSSLSPSVDDREQEELLSEHELSSTGGTQKRRNVSPAAARASAVLLLSILFLGGCVAAARRERRPLGPPVPTDPDGLKGTLESLDKAAERVQAKLSDVSEPVLVAFRSFYSPASLQVAVKGSGDSLDALRFLIDKYVKAVKSVPFPDESASRGEKEDYALWNLTVAATLRAAEIRLDQLDRLEKFAAEHPGTPVYHLGIKGTPLRVSANEGEEPTVSFAEFAHRLESQGIEGVTPGDDSGLKVPEVLVERLTNLISIQQLIEESDQAVFETFQELLGFVTQAKFGLDSLDKKRVDNLVMPFLKIPFPFIRLDKALQRSVIRKKLRSLSPSKIVSWKKQWHTPGLQSAIYNLQGAIEGSTSLQKYERLAALSGWAQDKPGNQRLTHPFITAVSVL